MKKTISIIIIVPVLAFIVFLFLGKFFTDKYVTDAFERVSSGIIINADSNMIFNYSEIDSLPFTLQRFFKYSIDSGAVKPVFVRLKQKGLFKTDEEQPFKPLNAVEYFSIDKHSFLWDADLTVFPYIRVRAVDSYIDGKAGMLIKLLSSITVTDAKGTEYDYSGLFRFFSEAVCFPTALLPSENIRWRVIDETTAEVSVFKNGIKISAVFHFDRDGKVLKITTRDKYRTTRTGVQKDHFTMYCRDYKKFGNFNIPTNLEAEWNLPDRNFVYGKINITEIQYDIIEMYR